jgi:hypothetical protein
MVAIERNNCYEILPLPMVATESQWLLGKSLVAQICFGNLWLLSQVKICYRNKWLLRKVNGHSYGMSMVSMLWKSLGVNGC